MNDNKLTQEQEEQVEKFYTEVMDKMADKNFTPEDSGRALTEEEQVSNLEEYREFFDDTSIVLGAMVMNIKADRQGMQFIALAQKAILIITELVVTKKVTGEIGSVVAFLALDTYLKSYEEILNQPSIMDFAEFCSAMGFELE